MAKKEVFNLTIDVGANIQQAKNAAESLRQAFAKVNLSDSLKGSLDKTFANLEKEITNFEGLANKPFKNMSDIQKVEKSYGKIVDLFSSLEVTAKNVQGFDLGKLIPKDTIKKLNELETGWKDLTDQVEKNKKAITKTITAENNSIEEQRKKIDDLRKAKGELNKENQKLGRERGTINNQLKSRDQSRNELVQEREALKKERDSVKDRTSEQYADLDTKYNKASQAVRDFDKETKKLNASSSELSQKIEDNRKKITQYDTDIKNAGIAIGESTKKIEELTAAASTPEGLDNLRKALADLKDTDIDEIPTDLGEIREQLDALKAEQVEQVSQAVKNIGEQARKTQEPVEKMGKAIADANESGEKLNETAAEVERLGNQVKQFFSIGNAIQLFKRTIRDAMNTVKELDKAMTETATVTDFSISDMWEQLPRYTEEANKLGTSINSLYKATTLYYQQGLQTEEAMALGIETIKMARVASMDAAQATDLMTAALRGFNMELNEQSAIRINDVYSELAAVTAADTDEIGIAISKTASIAHSANMEFETTAAFLSQIIETTREAPETAGTAMKTIVARFSEVKKLYSEGQITGTDEEGEIVNVNKIQEALRTVGIDMTKFFTGKEGLDQVLLRLAEKWNTLDVVTQRYIATQAAGSRQQSRFLAMMSDYDRTLELVNAAYNSAGSGQAQFEKTLDSMEAKLAELKNAWDQFVMGIANNEILKAGIDTLTKILSTINGIISRLSGNNGLIKSVLSLGASFLTLRGGAKLFNKEFAGKISAIFKGEKIEKEVKKSGLKIGKELGNSIGEGINKTTNKIKEFFSKENFGIGVTGTKKLEKINYKKIDRDKFEDIIANNAAGLGGTLTTDQIQVARVEFETNGVEAGIKTLQDFGAEIKVTKQGIQDWGKAATAAGQSLMGLGVVVSSIGGLISKNNEEAGEIVQNIGMVMTVIGGIIAIIPSLVAGINSVTAALSANPIGAFITAITLSITLLIGLISILSNFTPEKKLERAKKKAEESAKKAQEAQQAYDDLLSNRNNYTELEEKVASLTKGTQEWKDAVAELNSKVLELIENYEDLELEYDSEGNLIISKESWDKVEKKSKEKVDKTTATALSDQINVAKTQVKNVQNKTAAVDSTGRTYSEVELRTLKGTWSDDEWDEYLKSQEIKFVPTIDLSDAEKKLDVARKNLILAFMPDSVDKKEANQVGKALTTLIGEAIDEETDPEQIQDVVNKYYEQYKSLTEQQKAILSGQYDLIPGSTVDTSNITDEDLKAKVDKQVKIYEDTLRKIPQELARITGINEQSRELDTFLGLDKNTALKLTEKTSEMGTRAAQAYYKAWMAIDNKKIQENLLNFEIGNINDLTSIIKLMRQAQIEEEKIQDYWKAAAKGAGEFEIKMGDIINRAEALSTELKSIEEFGKRAEEGSLTSEDIEKILGLGFDFSNLQKTAEGWRLIGVEIETVKRILAGELVEEEQITVDILDQQITDTEKKLDELFNSGIDPQAYLDESAKLYDKLKELRKSRELAAINEAYAEASKYTAIENEAQGGSEQSVIYSVENEAQQTGFDSKELNEYAIALQNINTNLENDKTTAYEVALGNMKLNAGLGEIIDSYDDWSGLIDKNSGLIKATTSEDVKAFNELKKSVNKMLNTSEDLSEKFWNNTKNIENLTKAAKGDTKALGELQKAAGEDYLLNIDMSGLSDTAESDIQTFLDYYKSIDIPPLEPGVDMSAVWSGADEFTEAFNIMAQQANLSSEQIMKAAQNMGFDAKVEYVKQTRRLPIYEQTEQKIDNGDGTATIKSGTPRITGYEDVEGYFPVVKTFTPIGTGGGGVSTGNIGKGKGNGKKGGGSKGSSKKQNNWKNPYDKYYNLTEKINEALRTREKIERDYDRILNRRERSVADILKNSEAEIKNLKQEVQYQKQLQAGRLGQLKNVASEKYDDDGTLKTFEQMGVTKYAKYNFDTQTIEIDWEAIEKVRDERLGKAIEAYVSRLEELQGQFEETQDTIEDMQDQIWEINQRGKQEYLDFEQKIIDALVNEQQKIIDDLSAKFDGINEANESILNSMQEQIDLERQIRDNTKTEEDIAKKEARLAYLRRDTSGANATEIMKLEQDLADARQNYTDTLIDQGMQKLSDDNQKAAEQRQQQIKIMQAQHDWMVENGGFNDKAQELFTTAFDKDGKLKNNSELIKLLKQDDNFKALTDFGQANWWEKLHTAITSALEGYENLAKETYNSKNNKLTVKDKDGKEAQIWWNESKNVWTDDAGNTYSDVNAVTGFYGSMTAVSPTPTEDKKSDDSSSTSTNNVQYYQKPSGYSGGSISDALKSIGVDGSLKSRKRIAKKNEETTPILKNYTGTYKQNIKMLELLRAGKLIKYVTGGLADFTGPAWLDGTKAHPELVLNARDTENFIQLKDILSGMGSLDKLQNGGDNYYNFDIKVDQLASDYDVDKLIGKIKNEIDKDARYRNVNSINFIR